MNEASNSHIPPANPSTAYKVEACVGSLEQAKSAERAGADRIELNFALELDGLTPSAGLLGLVADCVQIPIIAMARPRAGDFHYSDDEWETLKSDARWILKSGADGIAFGCLDEEGQVDLNRCQEIRQLAGDAEIVFHKAFDVVPDWHTGLEALIIAGVNRVMTSGQQATAIQGIETIHKVVNLAANRIEVIPAGGVRAGNAVEIVRQTGCCQVHGSFNGGEKDSPEAEIQLAIQRLNGV